MEKTNLKAHLKTTINVDDAINLLMCNIQASVWALAHIPQPKSYAVTLPLQICMLIVKKRCARFNWQRIKYLAHKCHYNALTQKLKRLLSNFKNESYINYTTSFTEKDGSLWKASKQKIHI